jgi:hypothetical protein
MTLYEEERLLPLVFSTVHLCPTCQKSDVTIEGHQKNDAGRHVSLKCLDPTCKTRYHVFKVSVQAVGMLVYNRGQRMLMTDMEIFSIGIHSDLITPEHFKS